MSGARLFRLHQSSVGKTAWEIHEACSSVGTDIGEAPEACDVHWSALVPGLRVGAQQTPTDALDKRLDGYVAIAAVTDASSDASALIPRWPGSSAVTARTPSSAAASALKKDIVEK
jgi:hypothetical protein